MHDHNCLCLGCEMVREVEYHKRGDFMLRKRLIDNGLCTCSACEMMRDSKELNDDIERFRRKLLILVLGAFLGCLLWWLWLDKAFAMETIPEALSVKCVVGEGASEGLEGMTAISEIIRRRGSLKGVYGCNSNLWQTQPLWVIEQAEKAWKLSSSSDITLKAQGWGNASDLRHFRVSRWWIKGQCRVVKQIGAHYFWRCER